MEIFVSIYIYDYKSENGNSHIIKIKIFVISKINLIPKQMIYSYHSFISLML